MGVDEHGLDGGSTRQIGSIVIPALLTCRRSTKHGERIHYVEEMPQSPAFPKPSNDSR